MTASGAARLIGLAAHIARESWDEALAVVVDGRDSFAEFVDAFERGEVGGDARVLVPVYRLLKALLDVDMTDPANRKGDIPRVLGLVTRGQNAARDHAIAWALYRLFEHPDCRGEQEGVSLEECARAVAAAFAHLGIDDTLSGDNVLTIAKRINRS